MKDLIQVKAGVSRTMKVEDQPSFEEWMTRIDKLLSKFYGMVTADLEDCTYRDWYDKRLKPVFAAKRVIKNSGAGRRLLK